MFKKFSPKEDIASNAPMKSSLQRQIRSKLLEQLPFLSLPAVPIPHPAADDASDSEPEEDVSERRKKGAGKEKKGKGGGGGGGKGGKKGRRAEEEQEQDAQDGGAAEEVTVLDTLWPKKEGLSLVKCREHVSMYTVHGEPLFFQHFDGPFYPTLKVLHRYPEMLPRVGVDRGAIKFVLGGANIMCPGMTSATGYLPPTESNIPKGEPVAVYAHGKETPLAIGMTAMSTDDIRSLNKNIGVEMVHFLGDDLWKVDRI